MAVHAFAAPRRRTFWKWQRGASSLKKRLRRSPSVVGYALGPPTTLTACHGCLMGAGSFVFVTICRSSAGIRQRQVIYNPRNACTTRPSENERKKLFLFLRRSPSTVLSVVSAAHGGL